MDEIKFSRRSIIAGTVTALSAPLIFNAHAQNNGMTAVLPVASDFAKNLAEDGEFRLASRFWNGGIILRADEEVLALSIVDGEPSNILPTSGDIIELSGSAEAWGKLLKAVPDRFQNDLAPMLANGLVLESEDHLFFCQYFPALARLIEVARPMNADQPSATEDLREEGYIEDVRGRYIHVKIHGEMYRIYYEEAGQGIPILLHHTAGAHGAQWRHVFEDEEITSRFRLIAYDLPFHGKSLPPVGRNWWSEEYKLTGEFVRGVPLGLARALKLDRPVFMGCSVGGVLALDLAYRHPESFRAVISLEGVLKTQSDTENVFHDALYHPQVFNAYKARLMHGLTGPNAPEAYRRETAFVYESGWTPAFAGDLYYYHHDFDLRDKAASIDTSKVAVHIFNGEYDHSGSWELGQIAHETISGSTWTKMKGVGHFPMSEDPATFMRYLKPILNTISD